MANKVMTKKFSKKFPVASEPEDISHRKKTVRYIPGSVFGIFRYLKNHLYFYLKIYIHIPDQNHSFRKKNFFYLIFIVFFNRDFMFHQ